MLEWRQEKGRAEEWDWRRYSPCFPRGSSLRRPVWPQATAPGSQPSTDHSNCSLLLQQAYLAHATDPLVLHASFRFPESLTIALQMCPLLESLQTLSVCSYWASKALGCCSREGRMLYCTRRMLELLSLSWSSTRNVHSLPRRHRRDSPPIARERAGEQAWHTVRVLKQCETGGLSQDHLERKENYYQGRKRVLQWARRMNHLERLLIARVNES